MKIYVTYLTHYTGKLLPPWYIGSSYKQKVLNGYHGTVKSKKYKIIYKNELKNNPQLFKTRILKEFKTHEEVITEELRLQQKHNVVKNKNYINMSFAKVNGFFGVVLVGEYNPNFNKRWNKKQKKHLSILKIDYFKDEAHRIYISQKRKEYFKNNPQAIEEIRIRQTNKIPNVDTRNKMSNSGRKRWQSTEQRKLQSIKTSGKNNPNYGKTAKRVTCEYCFKTVAYCMYIRWHGKKCKMNMEKQ